MTLLNQIIAVQKGVKTKSGRSLTEAYHTIQRKEPLVGITRVYTPRDEDGDKLPDERKDVQVKVNDVISDVTTSLTRLFDVVLTQETGNTEAKADVVVGDQTVLNDVPVTYLLFLEKQLTDIHTFVANLPTLDPAERWEFDSNANVYRSREIETVKTKKVPRNHVKAEATDKHPAQVELYHEDVAVGNWRTTKFSGALPAERVATLLNRVDALTDAVKFAREKANGLTVTDKHAGQAIFEYIFAD